MTKRLDKKSNETKKRLDVLEKILKVKENQLFIFVKDNNKMKKDKEKVQKELDGKINMENIKHLTDNIKIAQNKIVNLKNGKLV